MGLKRKTKENKSSDIVYTNLEHGEDYEARLVYVADLGIHGNEYKGVVKPDVQKLALGFEVLGQTVEIDGEEQPRLMWAKPFNIYYSLTDKGAELKNFNVFDPKAKEGEIADWESVLGTPVSITIENIPDKKDPNIVYDNICAITAIPKKYHKDIEEGIIEVGIGDSDDEDNHVNKALYGLTKWTYDRRKIEESPDRPEDYHAGNDESGLSEDDEIPF